jgi:colanic acid biosynthesis glycosyl transferase WcaI
VMDGVLAAERRLLSKFDVVSSISPKMVEAIGRKGVPADRLMLLPNWVDRTQNFPLAAAEHRRDAFGIPEASRVALYSGSMGEKQGLEIIVAAARECASMPGASPLFVLAGDGPARKRLEAMAQGLSNVMFLPVQPNAQFNRLVNAADIHLLPQRAGATDLVMPSKLGAIFAAGRPVIATVPPDSQIAVDIGAAGIIVPPEDATALAAAVRELAAAPERRERMGQAALKIAATWDADVLLGAAEQRLRQLCRPTSDVTGSLADELGVP